MAGKQTESNSIHHAESPHKPWKGQVTENKPLCHMEVTSAATSFCQSLISRGWGRPRSRTCPWWWGELRTALKAAARGTTPNPEPAPSLLTAGSSASCRQPSIRAAAVTAACRNCCSFCRASAAARKPLLNPAPSSCPRQRELRPDPPLPPGSAELQGRALLALLLN